MSNVDNLSEEDFDKQFDAMMEQTPEDFDASQAQTEETQLDESPSETEVPEANDVTDTDVGDINQNNEQPEEELSPPEEEEPTAVGESEASEKVGSGDQDSQVTEEYNFNDIPRNKIIPKDIQVNGMTVRATMDELEAGFKKGMNYTQKMQEIAPHRRDMNLMMENGLTTADLNLLVEAKSGNTEALSKLVGDAKVDLIDLETENSTEYVPQDYGKDVPNIEMEQVKSEILSDNQYAPSVEGALQSMPDDMYEMVSNNHQAMAALYTDVKSDLYSKVMPEVVKQQALYGKQEPTLQTYLKVAKSLMDREAPNQEEAKAPVVDKELNNRRKNAGTTPSSKPKSKDSLIQKDLKDMDEEEFEKEFQKMIGRSINDFNN